MRIDDDDIELHSMDTIDLTGLYTEESGAGDDPSAARADAALAALIT